MATMTHKVCVYHNSQFDYLTVSQPSSTWDSDPVMTRVTKIIEVEFPLLDDAESDHFKIESLMKFRRQVESNYKDKVREIDAQINSINKGE